MSSEPLHGHMQHPLLPTTTSRPEPAPESLLTSGEGKRSWAALEPEFVESNDMNGMAPSSAILQADHLVIDDDQILADKADRSVEAATIATTDLDNPTLQPASKKLKVGTTQPQPSATDLAALGDEDTVIQPALSFTHVNKSAQKVHPLSSSPTAISPTSSPIPLHSPPQPQQEENQPHARKRSASISRGRVVAQLAPSHHQSQPFIGEELKIAETIGDPIDTTRATMPMSIYLDPGPPPASMLPLIGSRKPSLRPGKDTSIEKLDAWHDDVTMTGPFGTKVTAAATASQIDPDVAMADIPSSSSSTSSPPGITTLPSEKTTTSTERPVALNKTRRPSASFVMSTTHPFGQPKKGAAPKHVRIQILDDAETAKLREATEQAQREQDLTIQNEIEQDDARKAEEELLLLETGQKKSKMKRNGGSGVDDEDDDIVLPIEDPVTHDWDREELEDDGDGGDDEGVGERSRATLPMPRTSTSVHSRKVGAGSSAKPSTSMRDKSSAGDGNDSVVEVQEDDDEYDDDTDNDPEQQLPAMSETQEEESHNSHVRLETQVDFQLTAGLDRGELDANAYDEEGRYIGCIEQDDEGDCEYENR